MVTAVGPVNAVVISGNRECYRTFGEAQHLKAVRHSPLASGGPVRQSTLAAREAVDRCNGVRP